MNNCGFDGITAKTNCDHRGLNPVVPRKPVPYHVVLNITKPLRIRPVSLSPTMFLLAVTHLGFVQ